MSRELSIYLLSNDYVRNYYYQLAEDTSEETRLDIQDKVSEVNNERLKFLISHRISFVYDYNVNNIDCYEEIHKKLHNNSFKQFKIRIHSDDNYNIKSIHDKQKKEITLDDSWFDYVIYRTDDEKQFKKDMGEVVLKIKNLMES